MTDLIQKSWVFDKEQINYTYNSITINKILSDLQNRGFNYLFKLKQECIYCDDYSVGFDEFDIAEVHSLESVSPNEHHVLYAIKCDKYNIKGIIVSAFENYANSFLNICINKILNNEKLKIKNYK